LKNQGMAFEFRTQTQSKAFIQNYHFHYISSTTGGFLQMTFFEKGTN